MKQFIIFTEYVRNNNIVKERLKSILAHTISVSSTDKNGKATTKAQELSIDSYRHHDKYGGDNFDEMAYVALGDSAHPVYYRDKESDITTKVNFVVNEIEYDKKVFQPGSMTIKLSINPNTELKVPLTNRDCIKYVKEVFFNESKGKPTPAAISVVGVESNKVSVNDTESTIIDHMTNIAVRYLVFSFKISIVDSTRYVTLQCYSPDKLMELSKYSKVYSGQQFGEEIVKGEMALRFGFHESFVECAPERLRNLSMTDTAFGNKKRELVQPYLVQYNESFYDFIRRVAVRCGEFMCYRNDKFCIGLPSTLKPKKLTGKQIFTYSDVSIESNIALAVDSFASDYTESELSIKAKNKDKSKDVLEQEQKDKENKLYYVSDYVDDEQQHILCKTTDYDESRSCWMSAMAYDTVCKVLPSAKEITDIATAGTTLAKDLLVRAIIKKTSEKNFDTHESVYPEDVGIQRKGWEMSDKEKKMKEYTILDETKKKFLNQFYYNIEQGEFTVERAKVDINFSSEVPDLDLTDAIDLDDGIANYYIVSRMYGSFVKEKNSNVTVRKHSVEVIPTLNDKMQPCYTDSNNIVVLPPHCGIPHILKATAQEAVVVDTKDPLQIGRVRVRYLWQITNKVLSPWIRVLVPFTGGGGGMLMTPADQDHVMINYTGGNIERPYVSGFLYTAERFPNKGVAAADKRIDYKYTPRAITSCNGHSITFNDDKPKSFMNFLIPPLAASWNVASIINKSIIDQSIENLKKKCEEAETAYHENPTKENLKSWTEAKDNYNKEKKNSKSITKMEDVTSCPLNGGIVLKDVNGFYEINMSASKRNISIKSPMGDIKMNAFTGISISAPNGDINITGKNVNIKAGNNVSITSGTNIRRDNSKDYLGTFATWGIKELMTQGTSFVGEIVKDSYPGLKGAWDEMKNFTDLSFIRSCWEIIMRPVEGTLTLQSKRNVLMMAGVGKAWVPTSLLSKAGTSLESNKPSKWLPSIPNTMVSGEKASQNLDDKGFAIISLLRYTKQEVKAFYKNYEKDLKEIRTKFIETRNILMQIPDLILLDSFEQKINIKVKRSVIEAAWDKVEIESYDEVIDENELNFYGQVDKFENITKNFVENYKLLLGLVKKFHSTYCEIQDTLYKNIERHWKREAYGDKFTPPAAGLLSHADIMGFEIESSVDFIKEMYNPTKFENYALKVCIYYVLSGFKDAKYFVFDPATKSGDDLIEGSEEDWQQMVNGIGKYENEAEAESMKKKKELLAAILGPVLSDFGIEFKGDSWSIPSINGLINRKGAAGPRAFCEYEGAGGILMSSDKGFTQKIGGKGNGVETLHNPDLDAVKTYLSKMFDDVEPLVIT